jgi:glutamyl-tRNA synthetase
LNPSGKGKMSKREGRAPDGAVLPVFVRTFEELGYLQEAMVNYMALVGWSFDGQTELMDREELIDRFSLERVNASPGAWDYDKLANFNGLYIRNWSAAALTKRLMPFLEAAGLKADYDTMLKITPTVQERLTMLSDVVEWVDMFFIDKLPDFDLNLMVPKKMSLEDIPRILNRAHLILAQCDFNHAAIEEALRAEAKALDIKVGQMFQPIRVAVCGKMVAPPLFETLEILGKNTVLKRIEEVLQRLEA